MNVLHLKTAETLGWLTKIGPYDSHDHRIADGIAELADKKRNLFLNIKRSQN